MSIVYKHEQTQQKREKDTMTFPHWGYLKISHQKANNFFCFKNNTGYDFLMLKFDAKGNFKPCLPTKNIATVIFIICFQMY